MTSVQELLDRGAASPSRRVDVRAVVHTARRRRRQRQGVAMVLAVLMLGGALLAAVDRDEDRSPSVVVPPAAAPDLAPLHVPDGWTPLPIPEAGIALALPPGWSRLPDAADSVVPNVQLGTGTPPARDAPATCTPAEHSPAPRGAWLELYRYPGSGPFPYPNGPGGLPPDMIVARPNFLEGSKFDMHCIAPAGEVQDNGVEGWIWAEQGRVFFARIVVVGDPEQSGKTLARQILDTLRVLPDDGTTTATPTPTATSEVPSATQSPAPSTTSSVTPSTLAPSAEERALRAVLVAWMDGSDSHETGQYVEDGDELTPLIEQGKAQHTPETLATFRGVVDDVTFVDESHATFHFTQSKLGSVLFRHLPGTAVKIDGEWKVSRETMCEHLARGGIICPPRDGSTS